MKNLTAATVIASILTLGSAAHGEQVGEVGVDWLGNDIIIEAVEDPGVTGVTCHVAYFERGLVDRLQKGNWFEDPSNSSIACRQTGPITLSEEVESGKADGDEVFKKRTSLIFKTMQVVRFYDRKRHALVYLTYSDRVVEGSPKNSVTAVPIMQWR